MSPFFAKKEEAEAAVRDIIDAAIRCSAKWPCTRQWIARQDQTHVTPHVDCGLIDGGV